MRRNGATGNREETVCGLFSRRFTSDYDVFVNTGCVLNVDFPPLSFASLHHPPADSLRGFTDCFIFVLSLSAGNHSQRLKLCFLMSYRLKPLILSGIFRLIMILYCRFHPKQHADQRANKDPFNQRLALIKV